MVYQTPQFFVETLAIHGIQLTIMFYLISTLCKGGVGGGGDTKDGGYIRGPFGINYNFLGCFQG
jgi:hypothetical protein